MSKKDKKCHCEQEKEINEECTCEHENCCCENEEECCCGDECCGSSEKDMETYDLLSKRIQELNDALLRSQAELLNYKKRKDEETTRIIKYAEQDILEGFLPILDNFERAISMDDNNFGDETSKFLEGFRMVYNQTRTLLEKFEVKEILTKFDEIESINDIDEEENGIKIHIGKDSELSEDVSVIKTKYNYNGEEGTIAIIGPKRMEYERVVNLLNYIKENIDNENK